MLPTISSAVTSSRFSPRSFALPLVLLACALAGVATVHAELKLVEHWPVGGNVCVDAPLRLAFDHPPEIGGAGKIEVCRVADGRPVETIALGAAEYVDHFGTGNESLLRCEPIQVEGNVATVRLRAGALHYGESYFVRLEPGAFKEFAGVANGWRFTTKAAPTKKAERLLVAADGTGDFCTVQGAVDAVEPNHQRPVTIFVRKGRYEGLVRVGREKSRISLVGEDREGTIISGLNNDKLNPGWIQRAVLGVQGDDFVLENLTVQNRTPYKGSQAEAVYVSAERCTLRNATFLSFQDTLNVSGSVHVHDCLIEGDVDYVWGYGTVLFERCELRSMHEGYIVQARNAPGKPGYFFVDCKLTAPPEVKRCWLARIEADRFPASQVVFVRCQMGPHIRAAGWQATGPVSRDLCFGEFMSTDLAGQPLDVTARDVSGRQLSAEEAKELSRPPFR